MTCPVCSKGELISVTKDFTYNANGTAHTVKNVPHLVCNNCNEEYIDDEKGGNQIIDEYLLNELSEEAATIQTNIQFI